MTVSKHVLIVIIALISNVLSAQHQQYQNQVVIFGKTYNLGGIGLGFALVTLLLPKCHLQFQ
jgi:hypothetical protein